MDTIRYAVLPFGPPPVVAAIVLAKNGRPIALLTAEDLDRTEVGTLIALANLGAAEIDRRTQQRGTDPGDGLSVGVDVR